MPKKRNQNEEGQEIKPEGGESTDETLNHPEQPVATADRETLDPLPEIESSIEGNFPDMRVYPQVRVGVCEFHGTPWGIVDPNSMRGRCGHKCSTDPKCPHAATGCANYHDPRTGEPAIRPGENYCRHEHNYNGLQFRCTFCPPDTDFRGVMKQRIFYVFQSPDNPKKLIIVCSDYRCRDKFFKRFMTGVV